MREFEKFSGAGNDFLVFQYQGETNKQMSVLTQKTCHRHFGIGADGAVFVESLEHASYQWHFFNADGSSAEMCGNAARCVARYLIQKDNVEEVHVLTSHAKWVGKMVDQNKVEIRFQLPRSNVKKLFDPAEGSFINTGVPHFVISTQTFDKFHLIPIAKKCRHDPAFGERGTNVTFYSEQAPGAIQAITFERGVEDLTLACGTGAIAAAKVAALRWPNVQQVTVQMPGGELIVKWTDDEVLLTGPVRKIAKGNWISEEENV